MVWYEADHLEAAKERAGEGTAPEQAQEHRSEKLDGDLDDGDSSLLFCDDRIDSFYVDFRVTYSVTPLGYPNNEERS